LDVVDAVESVVTDYTGLWLRLFEGGAVPVQAAVSPLADVRRLG